MKEKLKRDDKGGNGFYFTRKLMLLTDGRTLNHLKCAAEQY